MTIKIGQIYLTLFFICTFLYAQKPEIIAQKITIENSYQQKLEAAISPLIGGEKFLVIVSIEFSTIGGTLKQTSSQQTETNSKGTYIPGLPTVPADQISNKLYGNSSNQSKNNDLEIGPVDVIIGMNESSINGSIKQEIKSLIETIIPQTKNCEDCIKIQAMQFQTNKKNKRLAELEKAIENLEAEKRAADLAKSESQLNNLERQITAVTEERDKEREVNLRRIKQMEQQDSIRFMTAIEEAQARRKQLQEEKEQSQKKLEKMRENKDRFDSLIISEALGMYRNVMKQKGDGAYDNEPLLGMQLSGDNTGRTNTLIFLLLIILIFVIIFIAFNRKPKTIYLKPKDSVKEKKQDKSNNKEKKSTDDENDIPTAEPAPIQSAPKPDEDAMRSELKTLRQTAVSLTVGEKEGASALIKEWLEDNPNKEEGEGEGGEE